MRLVLQRVQEARVEIDNKIVGQCSRGLMILVGIGSDDTLTSVEALCDKALGLRIFDDGNGKMNLSIKDINGEILAVSQFTLYANCRHGRRPSFTNAAAFEQGRSLYEHFCACIQAHHIRCQTGVYGADMQVHLINDGPVTICLDSDIDCKHV